MAKIINVYINGTDETNNLNYNVTSLANVLHAMTIQDADHESICVEGCGVNNHDFRDLEAIFTFHLEAQIDELAKQIRTALSTQKEKLTLNLYGFSRGGAAVFWLCEKLKDISPDKLAINVCSVEPVPGNFIRAAYLDNVLGFKSTLSARIADLSECQNVNKMLVLFTNQPMLDIVCHGPILPVKPPQAKMTVDVLPGCHKSAELFELKSGNLEPCNNDSAITFHYVMQFLKECGTQFKANSFALVTSLRQDVNLGDLLDRAKDKVKENLRSMHFYNEIQSTPDKPYLNLFHKALVLGQKTNDASDCVLSVKDPDPQPSYWNGQKSHGYFLMLAAGVGLAAAAYGRPAIAATAVVATAHNLSYRFTNK